jgi:hypothetical protein
MHVNPVATRRRVFNAFNPQEVLLLEDPRYVDLSSMRDKGWLFPLMVNTIPFSEEKTSQLLCGSRGCGKTTELQRLQHILRGNGFFVVYCEADQLVDLVDIDAVDVLLAVVQQSVHKMAEMGIPSMPGKSQPFWLELWESVADLPEAQLGNEVLALTKLGAELKYNPTTRQMMRQYLRSRSTAFLEAVNIVIEHALQGLRGMGFKGLVVLVDNLDRVMRTPTSDTGHTSQEALFLTGAPYLTGIRCHTIYTFPPALLFSVDSGHLSSLFGTQPRILSMVPVLTRQGELDYRGIDKLVEVVEKRLLYVDASTPEVFDAPKTIERLCFASGGHIRFLISLVRNALLQSDDLPIETAAVEHAIRTAREQFTVGIRGEHWDILREVGVTKNMPDASESGQQLLNNLAVLNYFDSDGPWFDIHPVLREAPQLAAAGKSTG